MLNYDALRHGRALYKLNGRMIHLGAPSFGEMWELIWYTNLTVHYGDSLAIEHAPVVHLFLRCIVGLNECNQECPLWFRTPLKWLSPQIHLGYSQSLQNDLKVKTGWIKVGAKLCRKVDIDGIDS